MNYLALALAITMAAPTSFAGAARIAGENVRLQLADCDSARAIGHDAAPRAEDSWKWRLLGFALPGAGALYASATRAEPLQTAMLDDVSDEAVECYVDGYQTAARVSRAWWAAEGGVAGLLLLVLALGKESCSAC